MKKAPQKGVSVRHTAGQSQLKALRAPLKWLSEETDMMLPRRSFSCLVLAGILVVAGALCAEARGAGGGSTNPGKAEAADSKLPLIDLAGYKDVVASNHGKALMVTFWATWCQPCRSEFPMIEELAKKYGPQGLVVAGVSLDQDSELGAARQFLDEAHADFPNYRVKPGIDIEAFYQGVNRGWQGTMPQTVFYARDGHVARYLVGAKSPEAFEDAVRLILLQ
jgi:thiol-disulfide isomerase/thioredoxin